MCEHLDYIFMLTGIGTWVNGKFWHIFSEAGYASPNHRQESLRKGMNVADNLEKSRMIRNELRAWHLHGAGHLLLEAELAQMDDVLQNLFGYHLLQIGRSHDEDLLASSRISHRIVLDDDIEHGDCSATILRGTLDELPIASDSIDVVVLPHTLEFEQDPHRVLREVERVLIAEGHVVLLGLNPWSLWGMVRWVRRRHGAPPWCGRFLGLMRIKDWLALLGFDVVLTRQYFFRPPLKQEGLMRKLMFMEKIGARLWPRLSGAYLVVAKKRVTTLTPIKPRWKPRRSLIPAPAKPCTRGMQRIQGQDAESDKHG